ncbi:MAG: 2-amino-4-hydroxy-6-hydroxymethyldihydropteridine diphosphokinase, partial [Proteobacteria bacterium]|nr:2-amino-4-hydroxy-6-hydroxymethyldihydropteridine diphosphokinase [Pseudomonadota bacterium]
MSQRYLIALGSNVRHHRHGPPERVLAAALDALRDAGVTVG